LRALLDTHAFLWWNGHQAKLSARARRVITDTENEILLSVATVWEIALKERRGRLELPLPASRYVPDRMAQDGFLPLDIQVSHVLEAAALPPHHDDPFDRVLIAQAIAEAVPIITADEIMRRYAVRTIW
jgi:PIN domain nuclease of toxin-antitoxin system